MKTITLAHGAGGSITQRLIKEYIVRYLGGSKAEVPLEALDDAAVIEGIVLKSDSYTVKPLFFPGGDIGKLAVAGTVNDIAVMGAQPLALAAGFIFEEGFPISNFETILRSMKETCLDAGVHIITGDTKVVEKGALDQLLINTSGIGKRSTAMERNIEEVKKYRSFEGSWLLDSNLRRGDRVILSGPVGDHGLAILSSREGYSFEGGITSDVTPLNKVVDRLLEVGGIVCMKDVTRGGLSNALNEWSEKSKIGILVQEDRIPVNQNVQAACEMLGISPLEVGNEGKLVIGVVQEKAEDVLATLRQTKEGRNAQIIGAATNEFGGVVVETSVGGRRILPPPAGDPIPRIC
ncbi:MAG: hydrogenase expression/formation protein HypE [Candidatus Bathyarchaeia archaeon]